MNKYQIQVTVVVREYNHNNYTHDNIIEVTKKTSVDELEDANNVVSELTEDVGQSAILDLSSLMERRRVLAERRNREGATAACDPEVTDKALF